MKMTDKIAGRRLACIIVFSTLAIARAGGNPVLWPNDALTKVMRSHTPKPNSADLLRISGARAEIVSSQAVFRPIEDISAAMASITDLEHAESAAVIPSSAVRLQWVRYIDINRNTGGIPDDELVVKSPSSIPDPFWESTSIFVKANQVQPLWIEIGIPGKPVGNIRPSGYFLQAHFMSSDKPTIEVTVEHEGRKRTTERTFDLRGPDDKIAPR
ncbi:MAG: hypothetical protein ACYSWO_11495 [Planctomycetota bacterium]|jgi:hypothetical protein